MLTSKTTSKASQRYILPYSELRLEMWYAKAKERRELVQDLRVLKAYYSGFSRMIYVQAATQGAVIKARRCVAQIYCPDHSTAFVDLRRHLNTIL